MDTKRLVEINSSKTKRFLNFLVFLLIAISFYEFHLVSINIVSASTGSVTREELSQKPEAILPNNPFYGMKSAFRKIFTSASVSGALGLLNERAAEVFASELVAGKDSRLMLKALRSYRDASQLLKNRLSNLEIGSIGEPDSVEAENFFNFLEERLLTHIRFSQDLAGQATTFAERRVLGEIQADLFGATGLIFGGLEDEQIFSDRILKFSEGKSAIQLLRLQEALWGLIQHNAKQSTKVDKAGLILEKLLNELTKRTIVSLTAEYGNLSEADILTALQDLSGEKANHLFVFTQIAEYSEDSAIKNAINRVRFDLEMQLTKSGEITLALVRPLLAHGQNYASLILAKDGAAAKKFSNLVSRMDFYSKQAETLLSQGNPLGALLQVALLHAATGNLHGQLK